MPNRTLPLLLTLCLLTGLAACQPAAASPDATLAPTALPTPADDPAPTSAAADPDLAAGLPALSPDDAFVVIAALHANLRQLAPWQQNPPSPFERQAVIAPLIELGLGPLGGILPAYQPPPEYLDLWPQVSQLYAEVYPQALAWAEGGLESPAFWSFYETAAARAAELLRQAEEVAASLGVTTAIYGPPDYLDAALVVFRLLPAPAVDAALPGANENAAPRIDAPALQALEVTPFLYPFAGSDIFVVIGLVENTSADPVMDVWVEVRFLNFRNEHLGTSAGRLLADVALPGLVYPFSATTVTEGEEAALKDWTRYEVAISARPADAPSYQAFTFELLAAEPTVSGGVEVRGLLTNAGDQAVSAAQVRISVMARDAAGILAGVGEGYVIESGQLAPGESGEVVAQIEALSGPPADYQFYAEVRMPVP